MRLSLASCALLISPIVASSQETPHPIDSLALDSHIDWIDGGAVFRDGRRAKRSLTDEEQEVDRGAILARAVARAKDEGKLVFWYVPRIIETTLRGRQMYRAPILDGYMRQVVFCDTDVSSLLSTRFVPLRMTLDDELAERFSLRPLEFIEPAILFFDGDGEIVHAMDRIRTFDALWFSDLMLRVLDEAENRPNLGPDASVDVLLAHGLYSEALDRLSKQDATAESLTRMAGILRRQRHPEDALALLDEAGELLEADLGSAAERMTALDVERGRILTLTGRSLAALRPLDRAFRAGNAEAGYLLALNRLTLGDDSSAMAQFHLVAQRHPLSLHGRRALANTTFGPDDRPIGAAFASFEHYGYLPEAAYRGLPRDTSWSGKPLAPLAMAVQAVRFLLDHQRDDGGFTESRYAYWSSSDITTNTWVAISALACTALLEYRDDVSGVIDPTEIDDAIARCEKFMFDPKHLNRGSNEDVYADAYRVLYLTRRLEHRAKDRPWALQRMQKLLADAAERQTDAGFFSHEYQNAFCTSVMLWSLLEARDAGAELSASVLEAGATALLSARHENGAYSYGGSARGEGSLKDASGRMAACEAVLLRTGDGSRERLAFAMDTFWEFFDRLERVRRNDFHSDGELAGFFFFHDLFQTSEVLDLLPDKMRASSRSRFLEVLKQIPEIDGSFIDSHEFGRSYGTAMALLVLKNITD